MPILMPRDTREALGNDAARCESRSLLFDRFADPCAKDSGNQTPRKDWFRRIARLRTHPQKCEAWNHWLRDASLRLKTEDILFAQLQSRLMVNMAGGVMENAGLCLDRFGLPYIPGSAVKGCARRMAIQNFLEAREANEPNDKLARLLADMALVFGWGDQDWKGGRRMGEFISDFEFACGPHWQDVRNAAVAKLLDLLRVPYREHPAEPWKDLPNFAGSVSFLQAYPWQLPATDLELDVVTCHHPDYYSRKTNQRGDLIMPVALDTEDPNPVVFCAVAPRIVFAFAVLPLRGCSDTLLAKAHEWLKAGLEAFGLGAKTAAGYGWFKDISKEIQDGLRRADELQTLKPDPQWLEKFRSLSEADLRGRINKFDFDPRFWPPSGPETSPQYQLSLFVFLTEVSPSLYQAERAKPKSKVVGALKRLAEKLQRPLP